MKRILVAAAAVVALPLAALPVPAYAAPKVPTATVGSAAVLSVPDTVRPTEKKGVKTVKVKIKYTCVDSATAQYSFEAVIHQPTGIFDSRGGQYTGLYSTGGNVPGTGPRVYATCNGKAQTETLTLYSHDENFRRLIAAGILDIDKPPSIKAGQADLTVLVWDYDQASTHNFIDGIGSSYTKVQVKL